jgi:ankyrin repeat protein
MSRPLPLRANLQWLRKLSKERLAALRATDSDARLSQAQFAVAREFGFPSWRQLKAHVEQQRRQLDALVPADVRRSAAADHVAPDDVELVALLQAIVAGQTSTVAALVARRPALAAAAGPEGQTPLHVAAQHNDPQLAALLVAYGADLDATYGQSEHTPLSWAITCSALDVARALVKLGAEPDLFCAAGMGALDDVHACFDNAGALVEGASVTGSTRFADDGSRLPCPPPTAREQISDALYLACRNAQLDVARFLLGQQPDLSFRAYLGGTPLHWAHFGGSRAIVELLEQQGADVAARDAFLGCTPRAFGICVPANWGFAFLVRARLAEDASLVNIMDGRTSPLHEAAANDRAEIVRLLLAQGADPRLARGDGKTPLELALERGHAEVAEMLRLAGNSGRG